MAREIPADQLPELGDWDGPIYGQLGVLQTEEDAVQCHACGRWYKALAHHARWTHQLTSAEYKAIFGLNATMPLDSPALRAVKRRNHASRLAQYHGLYAHLLQEQDPEERRARASRPRRLQTHVDPRYLEVWRRWQRASVERQKVLWQDPAYAEARVRRMRSGRVVVPCAVCGMALELPRAEVRRLKQPACSGECRGELRRRLLAERGLDAPAVRAKAGLTRQQTLAARPDYGRQVGARISQARRRRDGALVAQLRALPAIAWAGLPEPDRSLVDAATAWMATNPQPTRS